MRRGVFKIGVLKQDIFTCSHPQASQDRSPFAPIFWLFDEYVVESWISLQERDCRIVRTIVDDDDLELHALDGLFPDLSEDLEDRRFLVIRRDDDAEPQCHGSLVPRSWRAEA